MIHKRLSISLMFAAALCMTTPSFAGEAPATRGIDSAALAEALKKCPGINGQLNPAALAEAAKNCPGLNGAVPGTNCPALNGKIDPAMLAVAVQNCPALNGTLPPDARKCPAFSDSARTANCPAQGGFSGPVAGPASIDKKIDKRMNRIVRALERNKKSSETLIQAAREAGADPRAIADLEKMSAAFREVFMSTVSPQQIIESILNAQTSPAQDAAQGIIIQAPDGSTWLISPADQNTPPPPPIGIPPKGPKHGKKHGPQGAPSAIGRPQMPQPIFPPQGTPPAMQQQEQMPAPQQPGINPPFRVPPESGKPVPQNTGPGPQGEVIIMEEQIVPQYMPLWPTKEDLGKDGVLKYLEKRSQITGSGM